jgi:hypothetical protein
MRSTQLVALCALVGLGLTGCNFGQPRIYRVAIDETPMRTIAVPSCFRNNNLPADRGNISETNYRKENEWVIWNGIDQTEYLDIGEQNYKLGDAPIIEVRDLIEGSERSFSALRNEQKPIEDFYTEARQTRIDVKFDDYSFAPKGSITLTSQYACAKIRNDCPVTNAPPDAASCSAVLNFVARRIEAQHMTLYNNNPR